MVEQTRQPRRVVSLQAGLGEGDTDVLLDVNLRINDRAARAFGSQLAAIGDQMDQEWAGRRTPWLPPPLHMLRPAQALTRTIYRDIHRQLWGFQGLSAGVKAWIESTAPGQGIFRADAWAAWVKRVQFKTSSLRWLDQRSTGDGGAGGCSRHFHCNVEGIKSLKKRAISRTFGPLYL
ncbi:bcl-2-interacting killer isoform X1 [Pseudochaenichthys georgianus]|uniref:bcl-2-interacting killer isoform X1 n=1 Tax=Pseudochaenichthys georgianus TaxID=52239 RepID=UPI00146E468B|nr:bcl-2-interacting killer isoform X1 [Pseudochaenichthys georgianus]XP_033968185.1 bcl-2-interacting killer isoform X1 [Pseudochaenichthys georgianus]